MDIIFFSWKRSVPIQYGIIKKPLPAGDGSSVFEKSLAYPCEKCRSQTDLLVYESHKKWKLYGIPLGKSDWEYDVFCSKCGEFQIRFSKKELYQLKSKNLIALIAENGGTVYYQQRSHPL